MIVVQGGYFMSKQNKSIEEIVVNNIILDSDIGEHSVEIAPIVEGEEDLSCGYVDADCCFDMTEDVFFDKCQDYEEKTVKPVRLQCQARLLKINVFLKNVCRGRKVAIGVIVCEGDKTRGFKGTEIEVPGKPCSGCTSIKINNFCFVLPERSICDKRKLKVKVIAHYTDLNPLFNCSC